MLLASEQAPRSKVKQGVSSGIFDCQTYFSKPVLPQPQPSLHTHQVLFLSLYLFSKAFLMLGPFNTILHIHAMVTPSHKIGSVAAP